MVGIDNDLRRYFFGEGSSTAWVKEQVRLEIPSYEGHDCDIRGQEAVSRIFAKYETAIECVIRTVVQKSYYLNQRLHRSAHTHFTSKR